MKRRPSPSPAPTERHQSRWLGSILAFFEERTVSVVEIELVLPTHRNNWLHPQIEAKLGQLDLQNEVHQDLHRLVTLSLGLLEAVDQGRYRVGRNWVRIDPWLRRALAYFVKNHDAIPDHFADGFDDDHREFTELEERLAGALDHFELWQARQGKGSGSLTARHPRKPAH